MDTNSDSEVADFQTVMDTNSDSEDTTSEPNMTSLEYAIKRSLLSRNKLALIMKNPDGVVQYCCVECTFKCNDKTKLEKHLLIHNKEYRYLCGICGTGLKRKEHLDRHTLEHQEVRPHICPVCGKAFKRKEHMNIHQSIHSGDKSELCPMCGKSFYRKDHLRKHLQTHNKTFMEQNVHPLDQVLVEIKQEFMEEDAEPMVNEVLESDMALSLDEDVGNNDDIMTELQDSSSTEELQPVFPSRAANTDRPYACYLCNKTYKRRDHLKIHSWTHIRKEQLCSECGKAFHTEMQLMAHMNTHLQAYSAAGGDSAQADADDAIGQTSDDGLLVPRGAKPGGESRPHACAVCKRRFKRKQHLKQHLNVHFKPLQPSIWCSMCGEGFLSNDKFEGHHCTEAGQDNNSENCESNQPRIMTMRTKKENKYPEEFMDVSELATTDPAAALAAELALPSPQRVFVCKYCTKPFKRKDHYKIHLNIHTGIKSFFCPTCRKGFYRKDHMQKHMQVHSKTKEREKARRDVPDLFPINYQLHPDLLQAARLQAAKKEVKPEITIHAPSSTKLRVPLKIKVPYQMVVCMDNGEQRAVTIDPSAGHVS